MHVETRNLDQNGKMENVMSIKKNSKFPEDSLIIQQTKKQSPV